MTSEPTPGELRPATALLGLCLGSLPLVLSSWLLLARPDLVDEPERGPRDASRSVPTAHPDGTPLSPREIRAIETRAERRGTRAEQHRNRILTHRSELVVVGSSMVKQGLSPLILSQRLGVITTLLTEPGAASAAWYLLIENAVLAAERLPRQLVLVFRDDFLTRPRLRVTGKYRWRLDALGARESPLFEELVESAGWLGSHPALRALDRARQHLRERTEERARGLLLPAGVDAELALEALEHAFRDEAKDRGLLGIAQLEAEGPDFARLRDFRGSLESSFLPEIVRRLREAGVELICVRYKRLRDVQPGRQPPELLEYVRELRAYLTAEGVPLIDFSEDPRIGTGIWADGDHLSPEGQRIFSVLLAEALEPLCATGKVLPKRPRAGAGERQRSSGRFKDVRETARPRRAERGRSDASSSDGG